MNKLYHSDCLSILERIMPESIKLVYLDPPWTTKNVSLESYLLFLVERLVHCHRVLQETGFLFIHLPPELSHQVKVVLDEIFGKGTYVNQYILPRSFINFDYGVDFQDYSLVIAYRKSNSANCRIPTRKYTSEEIEKNYPNKDKNGSYRRETLFTVGNNLNKVFSWNGIDTPEGRIWKYSYEKLNELYDNDLIVLDDNRTYPYLKRYFNSEKKYKVGCIWSDISDDHSFRKNKSIESQQDERIIERIINMTTEEGDWILDPFCGSGTALVVAQNQQRKWIGCEKHEDILKIVEKRLSHDSKASLGREYRLFSESEFVHENIDLFKVNTNNASVGFIAQLSLSSNEPLFDYNKRNTRVRPLIVTEGKTDWMHLKSAYEYLIKNEYIKDLEIEFDDFNDKKMGDQELLKMCESSSKSPGSRFTIFVFDRDNQKIIRSIDSGNGYKSWGENTFSLALPIPKHRKEDEPICIEFYYTDSEITSSDKNNRRLYLSNEFNSQSGRHLYEDVNCTYRNKLNPNVVNIVDSMVFNKDHENIAMSKIDFAKNIYDGVEGFDNFNKLGFIRVFDLIKEILVSTGYLDLSDNN